MGSSIGFAKIDPRPPADSPWMNTYRAVRPGAGDFEKRRRSGIGEHFRSARNAAGRPETPFSHGLPSRPGCHPAYTDLLRPSIGNLRGPSENPTRGAQQYASLRVIPDALQPGLSNSRPTGCFPANA